MYAFGQRRGVLSGLVLVFAFLATLALPARAETPPGILVVGQTAEPKSLDPHTVTATNDFRILVNIYDGLVRFRPGTLTVEPALAESWDISPDGLTYTFILREGVRFHDGAPFDAEAVKFNFERMLDENHPFHDTGPFPLAFFFSAIKEVEAVGPRELRLRLDEPFAPLLSNLAYPTGLMVSPEAVRKYGQDYGRHPAGTGPFVFQDWRPNNRVMVVRNDAYWDGAPPLKGVIFRPITDPSTRLIEMTAGGIDVLLEVPPDSVRIFAEDPNFAVYSSTGPHLWFLILNTREGPFADIRMRRAANLAIDKTALVDDVLQGTATVAAGPVPAAFEWVHDEATAPYPYDPERARELIRDAGGEGAELTFYVAESGSGMLDPVAMATAIQADLAAVGLDARIETYEWNTFLAKVNAGLEGQADMAEMAWMTNDPDTLPYLALRTEAWPEQGGFNSGYYSNPEVDRLLERARRETDREGRAALYRKIQKIVHDDAPWVFVASWKQTAVTTAAVEDFALQPSFLLRLHKVRKGGEATGG